LEEVVVSRIALLLINEGVPVLEVFEDLLLMVLNY
jgi:hypothetical protein